MELSPAIQIRQKGKELLLCSVSAAQVKQLREKEVLFADTWSRDRPEGYQRPPDEARGRDIARYLGEDLGTALALMPQCLVLNDRKGKVRFVKDKDSDSPVGKISFPDDTVLYEVDGQHRILGLANHAPHDPDYSVPLVIICGLDRPDEALQFVTINTKQRRVKPDLVLRVLYERWKDKTTAARELLSGEDWKIDGLLCAIELAREVKSPWLDRIRPPGEKGKTYLVTEGNFIQSLEPVFGEHHKSGLKTTGHQPIQIVRLLWQVLREVYEQPFQTSNPKQFVIQKSPGIFPWHMCLPFLAYHTIETLGSLTAASLSTSMSKIEEAASVDDWRSPSGRFAERGGMGGFEKSAEDLLSGLYPEFRPNIVGKNGQTAGFRKDRIIFERAARVCRLRHFLPLRLTVLKNSLVPEQRGAYVVLNCKSQACYVGKSDKGSLLKRLRDHEKAKQWHVFNFMTASRLDDATLAEFALYHILKDCRLQNGEHPSTTGGLHCPYC